MRKYILAEKSFVFSVRIYNLYKLLIKENNEFDIARQVLKSGTLIGVNIEEAIDSYSKKEFVAKPSIFYKGAREKLYWLKLLNKVDLIENKLFLSLYNDCEEILKISGKIISTTKTNLKET